VSEEQGFIAAVLAQPGDDTARLVYADWLEERDDPRAAFLRAEVALNATEPAARTREMRERLHQARSGVDSRWLAQMDRPQAGWRVVRSGPGRKTYGKALPAFIHNFSYHLSTVDVYADGAIYCWGYVDLPLFRGKLTQGWVVPRAEVGGTLSVHNLGQARVAAAVWDHSSGDVERVVTDALRELNPTMGGLLDMGGTDTEVRDGIRYAKGSGWGQAQPYRVTPAGDEVAGSELPVLEVVAGGYWLRPWLVYADGLSQLGYATELMPLDVVGRMFGEGRLALSVPAGAWVALDGLGRFRAGEGSWYIEPGERIREASDLIDQLNGGPGAIGRCVEAHRAYESDPSPERRETLRGAYEAVPEHLRMYCGDMDSKDGPIRRILSDAPDEDDPD
jgi:uncharacterized protein (TIGR02996 family)